jgi:hypothetical protein
MVNRLHRTFVHILTQVLNISVGVVMSILIKFEQLGTLSMNIHLQNRNKTYDISFFCEVHQLNESVRSSSFDST